MNTPESTSTTLIDRVRADEPDAWKRLVDIYGPLVYGWCRQCGLQAEDAHDVGQEVFSKLAVRIAAFRREQPGDTFHGWLWTITRNEVRNHFRRQKGWPGAKSGTTMPQQLAQFPQKEPGSADSSEARDDAKVALVHRALEAIRHEFEDSSWQAFWRMLVQGHSSAEIAEDLGLSKAAIRQAKYRILKRLRRELEA